MVSMTAFMRRNIACYAQKSVRAVSNNSTLRLTSFLRTVSSSDKFFSISANLGPTMCVRGCLLDIRASAFLRGREFVAPFRSIATYSRSVRVSTRFLIALSPSKSTRSSHVSVIARSSTRWAFILRWNVDSVALDCDAGELGCLC